MEIFKNKCLFTCFLHHVLGHTSTSQNPLKNNFLLFFNFFLVLFSSFVSLINRSVHNSLAFFVRKRQWINIANTGKITKSNKLLWTLIFLENQSNFLKFVFSVNYGCIRPICIVSNENFLIISLEGMYENRKLFYLYFVRGGQIQIMLTRKVFAQTKQMFSNEIIRAVQVATVV